MKWFYTYVRSCKIYLQEDRRRKYKEGETRQRDELFDFGFISTKEETIWRVMAGDPRGSLLYLALWIPRR